MWNLKHATSELIYETEQTQRQKKKLMITRWKARRKIHQMFGMSRYKQQQIQTTTYKINKKNKVFLYSTGKPFQYPVINHSEKEYEEEYICIIYVTKELCCTYSNEV